MFAAAGGPSPQHPYVVVAAAETLHVEAWPGDGRPVAVVPGLFGGAFTFRKVVPLLAALGYRPIVIEPLGTGFSSRPAKADYSLAAQANRLAAVLDSLNAGPVLVLAHSLGAAMAYRLALDRSSSSRSAPDSRAGRPRPTTRWQRRRIAWRRCSTPSMPVPFSYSRIHSARRWRMAWRSTGPGPRATSH